MATNKSKFECGDVVLLRSGGPAMTVWQKGHDTGTFLYGCMWFDDRELKRDNFAECELVSTAQGGGNAGTG